MIDTVPASALDGVVEALAAGAAERDRTGTGLVEALDSLGAAGLLGANAHAGPRRPPAAAELSWVRRVAGADGAVGRVLDGHLNAVERLAVQTAPAEAADALAAVRDGRLRLGVWGGDPRPGEGAPAQVVRRRDGSEVLTGVKTFCSGAGALDRALVLVRDPEATAPVLVWIDLADPERVRIDRSWYRTSGLRASASHRVEFTEAPIVARCGGPGAISTQPWFGRDALRTAASWAGMADAAVSAALSELAARPNRGELEGLAAGRILGAQRAIDVWLEAAARAMDAGDGELASLALHARVGIADAARTILEVAAGACGSHPFATGATLDRVRRDLELFLLQHRLDPMLARYGTAALDGSVPVSVIRVAA